MIKQSTGSWIHAFLKSTNEPKLQHYHTYISFADVLLCNITISVFIEDLCWRTGKLNILCTISQHHVCWLSLILWWHDNHPTRVIYQFDLTILYMASRSFDILRWYDQSLLWYLSAWTQYIMGLPQSNKGSWWTWNSVQTTGISLNELYTITLTWQFNFKKVIILPHFENCNHFYLFTFCEKKSLYTWMQANNLI